MQETPPTDDWPRPTLAGLDDQIRRHRTLLLAGLGAGIVVFGAVALIGRHSGLPLRLVPDDRSDLARPSFYVGLLSRLEALLWGAAAAVCLFAARLQSLRGRTAAARFLFWSGALGLALTVDNLLMLHDQVLPRYADIPEDWLYMAYALLVGWYLVRFARDIVATDYLPLLLALGFLCASAVAKFTLPSRGICIFFQDGFKLIGVIFWFIYYILAALRLTQEPTE